MRRLPALKALLPLVAGISLAVWIDLPTLPTTFAALGLFSLSLILHRTFAKNIFSVLSLLVVGSAAYTAAIPPDAFQPIRAQIIGRVIDPPHQAGNYLNFPLRLEEVIYADGSFSKVNSKIWVRIRREGEAVHLGDRLKLIGQLSPFHERRYPFEFDLKRWLLRNGFIGTLTVDHFEGSGQILGNNLSIREHIIDYITAAADRNTGTAAPLVKALLLGYRRDLDPQFTEDLRVTGLAHLIALSGLHIGFFVALVYGLGALLRLPIEARLVLSLMAASGFALVVPPRGSTLRATIMALSILSSPLVKRWCPLENALAFAALVVLLIRPGELTDPGFQMSFAATVGIIFILRRSESYLSERQRGEGRWSPVLLRWVVIPVIISTGASIPTIPLTIYHFNNAAIVAPMFNLVAIPMTIVIYAGSFITVTSSLAISTVAEFFGGAVNGLVGLFQFFVDISAAISPNISPPLPPLLIGLMMSVGIYLISGRGWLWKRIFIASLGLGVILIWAPILRRGRQPEVWFLDVGDGDAQVWLLEDDQTVVIDGGPERRSPGGGKVAEMLKWARRSDIDLLVASHPEADHIGGLIEIVNQFPIGLAVESPIKSTSDTYHRLQHASKSKGLIWSTVKADDEIIGIKGIKITVEGPPANCESWSANNGSVVILAQFSEGSGRNNLRLLSPGDVERLGEAALAARGGIRAELLKAPHHGSFTSGSEPFLTAVAPKTAVISRDSREAGDEIAAAAKAHYAKFGIKIISTADDGSVALRPSDKGWRLVNWRNPALMDWLLGW